MGLDDSQTRNLEVQRTICGSRGLLDQRPRGLEDSIQDYLWDQRTTRPAPRGLEDCIVDCIADYFWDQRTTKPDTQRSRGLYRVLFIGLEDYQTKHLEVQRTVQRTIYRTRGLLDQTPRGLEDCVEDCIEDYLQDQRTVRFIWHVPNNIGLHP